MAEVTHRGTSNSNARGSAADRRARKRYLLDTFGDGTEALCAFDGCEVILTFETITVDRYPLTGIDGGTYVRSNIRPACGAHNSEHGGRLGAARREARRAGRRALAAALRAGGVPVRLCGLQRLSPALALMIDPT